MITIRFSPAVFNGGTPDYPFGYENQTLLETLVFPIAFDWE